jgi:hypothetical protein
VGPRVGLDRCGKFRLHRDSIPDRPAASQALYRLRHPGPHRALKAPDLKCGCLSALRIDRYSLLLHVSSQIMTKITLTICDYRNTILPDVLIP